MAADYSFLFHHVDIGAIGEHDMYNAFLRGDGLVQQLALWREDFEGCVPVGVCPEAGRRFAFQDYFALVFEDSDGRRFHIHVPASWVDEARVADQGEQAMEEARWKRDFGETRSEMKARVEATAAVAAEQLNVATVPEMANDGGK